MAYKHLNTDELTFIESDYHQNLSVKEIAKRLKRSRQTIYNVINALKTGITALEYYQEYKQRKSNCGRHRIVLPENQSAYIREKVADGWTPDTIIGYDSINLENINTNELILAVKIRDAFLLDKDESKEYPINESKRDRNNLKSRTLGNWIIGKDKIHKIKYIIGINTGANNAVVSAYEVSFEQAESIETNNGRMRYAFIGLSERDATLKNLNSYKKALPNLKFGNGSATAYINSYN
ncbi:helix-turn-helix domain-containing protein [Staphylococcus xylosus]|uniref:helix-turn-helix domain-containing protein n=1 Tax=Staphylococcus xylosus TaxID=1288 RepID=UPI001F4776C3|nr:helix-turn-helix domain-containing protein [Staphylococcus xylosus]MCE7782211.1 helix-turn-helix domain-containing protein [Staphylococcus xylosus]